MQRLIVGLGVAASLVVGCGGAETGPPATPSSPATPSAPSTPAPVASVSVSGSAALTVGAAAQWTAIPRDAAGNTLSGRTVTWSSSDTARAVVSTAGVVTARFPGTATITAASEGVSGSGAVTVSAPLLTQTDGRGPVGHIGLNVDDTNLRTSYPYGFSYYTMITTTNPSSAANTQLGWGVWITPNNDNVAVPLCPSGTTSHDQFTDRAASNYRGVYQTIEGGAGYWGNVQFPTTTTKFLIGGTPNCYSTGVSPGGYQMNVSVLPDSMTYFAQLSNRLLLPPDRLTFAPQTSASYLGYGWLALPIIPAHTSSAGMAVGDQSWTFFLNTSNFKGPVAFWVPDGWTVVNSVDRTAAGQSLDQRPAEMQGLALEICCTPAFEAKDSTGATYRRIPPMQFPADASRQSIIMQDVRLYSKAAIFDAVNSWLQGGTAPSAMNAAGMTNPGWKDSYSDTQLGGASTKVSYDTLFKPVATRTAGGGDGFALKWGANMTAGIVPEYYKLVGTVWTAVPASSVPRTTWLADQTFRKTTRGSITALNTSSAASAWTSARWTAGPFTATLSDGSNVDYVWYRFVDQPAIRRLNLSAAVLQRMQAWAESLHGFGTNAITIPAPSAGTLVSLDAGLLVTPPAGLETGYVPIVIRQY